MGTIDELRKFPTVIKRTHESCYRSYQTLQWVKKLIERGDSTESITEMISSVEEAGKVERA